MSLLREYVQTVTVVSLLWLVFVFGIAAVRVVTEFVRWLGVLF